MIVRSPLSFADASVEMLSVFAFEVLPSFSFAANTGVVESAAVSTHTAAVQFLFVFLIISLLLIKNLHIHIYYCFLLFIIKCIIKKCNRVVEKITLFCHTLQKSCTVLQSKHSSIQYAERRVLL